LANIIDLNLVFEKCKEVAVKAGNLLHDNFRFDAIVTSELAKDIKTQADKASEDLILSNLLEFNIPILTEESGVHRLSFTIKDQEFLSPKDSLQVETDDTPELLFIIDPLDGTFNFSRGFKHACVSIALWRKDNPIFGVVYDFYNDDLYTGFLKEGARCNGKKINTSQIQEVKNAILATGFPVHGDFREENLKNLIQNFQYYKKIRMIGSAAMSLANVATGIFDAYSESGIKIWDVAAGLAILKEAGGSYFISEVDENWQVNVAAHNGYLNTIKK
jgi:myo-inositol-1(or 4)-monophosphatase